MRRRARAVKGRVGVSNVVAIFELNCSSVGVWGGFRSESVLRADSVKSERRRREREVRKEV